MIETALAQPAVVTEPAVEVAPEVPATETIHVLHLEDNAADEMLMQEFIRDVLPDVEFDSASRLGDVTPERAQAAQCALVDLSLPDASGLEALLALREMSDQLPIIVLTGFDNLELGLSAVRFGADDYLIKNHVDGYTLERAIKYSIERRRLMLELATAEVATMVANFTNDQAAAKAVEMSSVSPGRPGTPTPSRAAVGTHEVAVRVDEETGEYALSCRTCDWEAGRGLDTLHSWAARSLDEVLLHHIDFSGLSGERKPAPKPVEAPLPRRGVFQRRNWVK